MPVPRDFIINAFFACKRRTRELLYPVSFAFLGLTRLHWSSSLTLTFSFFLPLYLALIAAPFLLLWPPPTTAHLLSARRTAPFSLPEMQIDPTPWSF
ncbi:hypothetical protein ACN42_g10000 [Penicillium freii]|uniref:Uncharacterized protein n=1 Tax=Penicillium freii TaxID=48697 RepID=A0A101MAU3_PENFR|nr:hypothetical protein ACN42_g10000 [Penicillium freii]